MDITNFITWFIGQVVNMFSWFFNILDNITFLGTSLLKVSITVVVLSVLIPVILTVGHNTSVIAHRSERIKERSKSNEKD